MNTVTQTETQNRPAREQAPRTNGAAAQPQPQRAYLQPPVNVVETTEGYVLEAEMPGVGKEGLEVQLENNELTIVGRRNLRVEGAEALYRESVDRDFRRAFVLDPAIDTAKISARIDRGVLTLTLPKAEQVKPRKISVE
jgi:HSP20 family molecular chaperone IbpA